MVLVGPRVLYRTLMPLKKCTRVCLLLQEVHLGVLYEVAVYLRMSPSFGLFKNPVPHLHPLGLAVADSQKNPCVFGGGVLASEFCHFCNVIYIAVSIDWDTAMLIMAPNSGSTLYSFFTSSCINGFQPLKKSVYGIIPYTKIRPDSTTINAKERTPH